MKCNPPIPLTAAQQELVADHLYIVWAIAAQRKRSMPKHVEIEDVVQMGSMGLMDAARKFDPDKGYKFSTYCPHRIQGAITDGMRLYEDVNGRTRNRLEAQGEFVPRFMQFGLMRKPGSALDGASCESARECPWAQDGYARVDELDTFNRMLVGIQEDTRFAMRLYYVEGLTMKEVGRAIGLGESRISQMITAALQILKSRATAPGQEVAA